MDAQEDVTFCIHKQMTTKTSDIVDIGTRFGGCKWNNKLRADRIMIYISCHLIPGVFKFPNLLTVHFSFVVNPCKSSLFF